MLLQMVTRSESFSLLSILTCVDPESFVRGGPTLTTFFFSFLFLVDEGRVYPNTTKSGPNAFKGHHWPASAKAI